MSGSNVKNGRQKLISPSTSPIVTFNVIKATISEGEITCENCWLVSTLFIIGSVSIIFSHVSSKNFYADRLIFFYKQHFNISKGISFQIPFLHSRGCAQYMWTISPPDFPWWWYPAAAKNWWWPKSIGSPVSCKTLWMLAFPSLPLLPSCSWAGK